MNDPDSFCYTCGEFTPKANRKPISDFYKDAYRSYFQVTLGDQDKNWAPHIVCKQCLEDLRFWTTGKRKSLRYAIPMIWREPQNHLNDCYFCAVKIVGLNQKKRRSITYPSLPSAIRPVPHSDDLPVPVHQKDHDDQESDTDIPEEHDEHVEHNPDFVEEITPVKFTESELNDLVRDLGLSKDAAELLASRLNEKHLLARDTMVSYHRNRDAEFTPFFAEIDDLAYCAEAENVFFLLVFHHTILQNGDYSLTVQSAV